MRRASFVLAILFALSLLIACGGNAGRANTPTTPTTPTASNTPPTTTPPSTTPPTTTPPTTTPPSGGSGSGGSGSGGTGSGGGSASAPSAVYVYTSGSLSDNIWGYRFDPNTGTLTLVPGSPFSPSSNTTAHALCDKWCGSAPRWLNADPLGKFLFEQASQPTAGTYSFTVDPATGALTQDDAIRGSSFYPSNIDPQGRFLVRTLYNSDQTTTLQTLAIDRSSGKLSTAGSAVLPTNGGSNASNQPAVGSNFVYDVLHSGNPSSDIYGYSVSSTLQLTATPGSPYSGGFFATRILLNPNGKWAYGDNYYQSGTTYYYQLQQYTVNSDGSLTKTGTPVQTNTGGVGQTQFTPNGKFLLYPDQAELGATNSPGMSVYLVDPNTGALTKGPFYANMRDWLAVDPTSTWVFESTGSTINVYKVDPNTGTLTKTSSAPVPLDPNNDLAASIAVVGVH